MTKTSMDLSKLNEPIPYKWRVQSQSSYGAQCVAYIDSRLVQDRLDEVVGKENWQDQFVQINDKLFCRLGINISTDPAVEQWVWKTDCGSESNIEKDKGLVSDSLMFV